jgi:hypothetical protein
MLIAPLVFGAVVSLLSHIMESLCNDKVTCQVAQAWRFMKNRRVPQELQRRVLHNLRSNALREHKMTLAPDLLAQLSPAVQRELLSELLRSSVLQFPLFKGANTAFLGEIAQAHTWVHCLPGDVVVEEGQLMLQIVFVIRGKLIIMGTNVPLGADLQDVDIHPGAWFGEIALFESDRTYDFSVVSIMESELAVLDAGCYHRIVNKYPRICARHRHILSSLSTEQISLDMFAYHKPAGDSDDHFKSHKIFQVFHHLRASLTSNLGATTEVSVLPSPDLN